MEVAEGVAADDVAVVHALAPLLEIVVHVDVEVVGPEVHQDFLELPLAVELAEQGGAEKFVDDVTHRQAGHALHWQGVVAQQFPDLLVERLETGHLLRQGIILGPIGGQLRLEPVVDLKRATLDSIQVGFGVAEGHAAEDVDFERRCPSLTSAPWEAQAPQRAKLGGHGGRLGGIIEGRAGRYGCQAILEEASSRHVRHRALLLSPYSCQ